MKITTVRILILFLGLYFCPNIEDIKAELPGSAVNEAEIESGNKFPSGTI